MTETLEIQLFLFYDIDFIKTGLETTNQRETILFSIFVVMDVVVFLIRDGIRTEGLIRLSFDLVLR